MDNLARGELASKQWSVHTLPGWVLGLENLLPAAPLQPSVCHLPKTTAVVFYKVHLTPNFSTQMAVPLCFIGFSTSHTEVGAGWDF